MLQPIVFGLNYQTANFELRNRLAFASEEIPHVLKRLVDSGIVKEVVLLSTCNRTELFFLAKDIDFVIFRTLDVFYSFLIIIGYLTSLLLLVFFINFDLVIVFN